MAKAKAKDTAKGIAAGKMRVGVIGCGNISGIYFKNLTGVFKNVEVAACADLDPKRSAAAAEQWPGVRACTVEELLGDASIDIVLNLTVPKAHVAVACAALEAGKHTYGEKPLAVTKADAEKIMGLAKRKKLRVGSAPDTFLGAGIQTAIRLIDEGLIGEPVAADAFMACHGHESWHPDPEFYYEVGGGPMLDMGPYYLTALIAMLGPVKRTSGAARVSFPHRTITSTKKFGKKVKVETPTHIAGTIEFGSGAVGTIVTTFDVWKADLPRIEIHGTEGSLSVPDPNTFGGALRVYRSEWKEWCEYNHTHAFPENSRGLGVADMAAGIQGNRPHRASGELAAHVLEVMLSFEEAYRSGRYAQMRSTCARPAPLPSGAKKGLLD